MKKIGLRLSVMYNEPVIGANIYIEGTSKGTVTDLDGKYTLEVPNKESQLKFSYVGLEDQTITIGEQSAIDVVLSSGKILDEVVVTAFRVRCKRT